MIETHPAIQISVDYHFQDFKLLIRENFTQDLLKALIVEEALVLYFLVFIVILSYLRNNLIIDCPQTQSFVE